jgi:hypothetical protein
MTNQPQQKQPDHVSHGSGNRNAETGRGSDQQEQQRGGQQGGQQFDRIQEDQRPQAQENQVGPSGPQAQQGETGSSGQRTTPGRKPLFGS